MVRVRLKVSACQGAPEAVAQAKGPVLRLWPRLRVLYCLEPVLALEADKEVDVKMKQKKAALAVQKAAFVKQLVDKVALRPPSVPFRPP